MTRTRSVCGLSPAGSAVAISGVLALTVHAAPRPEAMADGHITGTVAARVYPADYWYSLYEPPAQG